MKVLSLSLFSYGPEAAVLASNGGWHVLAAGLFSFFFASTLVFLSESGAIYKVYKYTDLSG